MATSTFTQVLSSEKTLLTGGCAVLQNVLMKAEQRDLRFLLERDQLRKAQSDKKSFFAFSE